MKTLARTVSFFVWFVVVAACGGGGGGAADAGADTDSGMLDEVGSCESTARTFAANCEGSDPRPCLWNGYASLCSSGRTALLQDSMDCLSAVACRTFSDPNDGAECLTTVHSSGGSAAAQALIDDFCNDCGGTECGTPGSRAVAEILPYLSDADIAAIEACRGSACTIDELIAACSSVPGLAVFASCL